MSAEVLIAAATAHRACCSTEHDPANGKLHGYCVVCGVPWPCETAHAFLFKTFPSEEKKQDSKPPPVKTVSAETLRRLKASFANHNPYKRTPSEFVVLHAAQREDNLMLSDLDEILAALEQRQ